MKRYVHPITDFRIQHGQTGRRECAEAVGRTGISFLQLSTCQSCAERAAQCPRRNGLPQRLAAELPRRRTIRWRIGGQGHPDGFGDDRLTPRSGRALRQEARDHRDRQQS